MRLIVLYLRDGPKSLGRNRVLSLTLSPVISLHALPYDHDHPNRTQKYPESRPVTAQSPKCSVRHLTSQDARGSPAKPIDPKGYT